MGYDGGRGVGGEESKRAGVTASGNQRRVITPRHYVWIAVSSVASLVQPLRDVESTLIVSTGGCGLNMVCRGSDIKGRRIVGLRATPASQAREESRHWYSGCVEEIMMHLQRD